MKYKSKIYEDKNDLFDAWNKFKLQNSSSVYPVISHLYKKSKMTGCYFEFDIRTKSQIEDFSEIRKVIDISD
jgi:hypothetical protein|tara:strand:- start:2045 stop:2260 length:216 start_codon:yes stop_codon:yes gene_type:complete